MRALRKYPSNLIRIMPAKGFEATSQVLCHSLTEVQSVKNIFRFYSCARRLLSPNPFSPSIPTTRSPPTGARPGGEKAFEADCNCELKLVALEDGVSLLNRLRMEGRTAKPMWCWGWTIICWKRPRKLNSLPKAAWRMRRSRCPAAGKRHICAVRLRLFRLCLR